MHCAKGIIIKGLLVLLINIFCLNIAFPQDRKVKPRKGDGVYSLLRRYNLPPKKYKNKFYELNKGKFGKKYSLLANIYYHLPNSKSMHNVPLFGEDSAKFKQESNIMSGAVFYLISGHGGPDPGAIGTYNKHKLHEDEYAYDVTLRLAKCLMKNGAKVYVIIQDAKDGIRENAILSNSKRETCMGSEIPLSQLKRLKQRIQKVNWLFRNKDKHSKYKRCISIHVDSRSQNKRLDVFFYHHPKSKYGKRLAYTLSNTFEKKYGNHQPGRGFSGTVTSRKLYVVRKAVPVVVFTELGNIQNKYDQIRFISPNNRQALANWIYEGFETDYRKQSK